MTRTPALVRLEKKLAKDPCASLSGAEIRALDREVRADLAHRYFHCLGIDVWVADWCRANRELATRVGLLDGRRTRPSRRRRQSRVEIVAELDRASGHIIWHCPLCGDNGLIHGWEDTPRIVSTTRARRRRVHRPRPSTGAALI